MIGILTSHDAESSSLHVGRFHHTSCIHICIYVHMYIPSWGLAFLISRLCGPPAFPSDTSGWQAHIAVLQSGDQAPSSLERLVDWQEGPLSASSHRSRSRQGQTGQTGSDGAHRCGFYWSTFGGSLAYLWIISGLPLRVTPLRSILVCPQGTRHKACSTKLDRTPPSTPYHGSRYHVLRTEGDMELCMYFLPHNRAR
jgi:hypothetical protein